MSVNRIGIFVISDLHDVVAPVTIQAAITTTTISSSVSVTGPAGQYTFITDQTIIDNLVRVTDLFQFALSTDVAFTAVAQIEAALAQSSIDTFDGERCGHTCCPIFGEPSNMVFRKFRYLQLLTQYQYQRLH